MLDTEVDGMEAKMAAVQDDSKPPTLHSRIPIKSCIHADRMIF